MKLRGEQKKAPVLTRQVDEMKERRFVKRFSGKIFDDKRPLDQKGRKLRHLDVLGTAAFRAAHTAPDFRQMGFSRTGRTHQDQRRI